MSFTIVEVSPYIASTVTLNNISFNKMYKLVKDELKNVNGIDFFQDSPQWYIDILVKNPDSLIQKLREHGIQARRLYRPVHQKP